jgi:glycosyltransferase involved in cell wall biosynthesis
MQIILCVTNDIVTDSRVNRIAMSLLKIPAEITIIGLAFPNAMPLPEYPFKAYRLKMLFKKGPLFYAEYNVRLFFRLLYSRADLLVANDLDTLSAVYLAAKFKALPLIYDSHEYFTELPELVERKRIKKIWERLETIMLPHIRYASTVSASIASEYKRKFGIDMKVVRNLPLRMERLPLSSATLKQDGRKIIMYQGSLNQGRGLEMAIRAMSFLDNSKLVIAGSGYLEKKLQKLARSLKLQDKVFFLGRILPGDLKKFTVQADLGISLEENLGLNYYYALPNKLFDYIQARIPVLVSDLPEMASIVNQYEIGRVIHVREPLELAKAFNKMLSDHAQRLIWQSNLEKASAELTWENEEKILLDLYRQVLPG